MVRNVFLGAVAALCLSGSARAADPLQAKPWVYDPDRLRIADAQWVPQVGLPDGAGKGATAHALYLTKLGQTSANAASGASINFTGTLTRLAFDIRNDSHFGNGAPRFNVYTTAGVYYFYGAHFGTHTPVGTTNWTHVEFSEADAFPSDGASFLAPGDWEDVVVTGIDIVFDEGLDQGNGKALLDNITVNGTIISKPGANK